MYAESIGQNRRNIIARIGEPIRRIISEPEPLTVPEPEPQPEKEKEPEPVPA